jgi:hypothetical protein
VVLWSSRDLPIGSESLVYTIVPDYPNIKIPSLTLETELGSIYKVKKVGFVLVDKSDCEIKK